MVLNNNLEDQIKKFLSISTKNWFLKDDPYKTSSFDSLIEFFYKIKREKNTFKDNAISYKRSINHFLIYYCYYPKFPFIIYRNDTIFFVSFIDRNFDKIEFSIPLFNNSLDALKELYLFLKNTDFYKFLKKQNINKITLRDIDDDFINILKKTNLFEINSLKEINYSIYDTKKSINLIGTDFSNLRWHLNSFKKDNHKIEEVSLKNKVKSVIHLIGKWRRDAIKKRDFSYVNMRSDKLGARFFGKNNFNRPTRKIVDFSNVISSVLKIDDKVASFNLGFPIGIFEKQNVFAHAVGICDLSISHLAEFSQYHFWKKIHKLGFKYVNDGPTWKKDLMIYKDKFKPIDKKRYYWADLRIK